MYPNNKPWVTKELKDIITKKHNLFKSINRSDEEQKSVQRELKKKIQECKRSYRAKLEDCLKRKDSKQMWEKMKLMTGCGKKKNQFTVEKDSTPDEFADKLNSFYARFDVYDFKNERDEAIAEIMCDSDPQEEFVVSEREVECVFRKVHERRACGPDGLKAWIFKHCSVQLSYIYSVLFNLSLRESLLPPIWKTSEIIPVPKKPQVKELNDLRPVALTSIVTKCLEKIISKEIKKCSGSTQDPMQFAYREKRSVEDAILIFLQNAYKHLDMPKNYCRILFVDFSSAFNTIQPHLIIQKLNRINLNKIVIKWILEFLTKRPQYVKISNEQNGNGLVSGVVSKTIWTNTGAPQGAVLSPLLFTAYTNDCSISNPIDTGTHMLKFADDTVIQGLISSENENAYRESINWFVQWCEEHFLLLNVKKTKELIIDFRIKKSPLCPLLVKNEEVEQVETYKYLGVTIDDKLNWNAHAKTVLKKLNSRLYFLRKLNSFHVEKMLLSLFYKTMLESIMCFALTCWGGNLNSLALDKFNRVIKKCSSLCNPASPFPSIQVTHCCQCQKKINAILKDKSHPFCNLISFSTRSGKPLTFHCRRERYRNSFLPFSIKFL